MNTLFPLLIFWYIKLLNIIYDERPREQNPIFVFIHHYPYLRPGVCVCVWGGGGVAGGRGSGESHMKIACETSTKKGWGRRYLV